MVDSDEQAQDVALLASFRAGEATAFESIVRRHYGGLVRLAEQRCGGGALAEDAVQTGLIRAHAFLRRNGEVSNLSAWLRRVVYNSATDLLEKERKGRPSLEQIPEPEAVPDGLLEGTELRALVAAAISRLGAVYREPLTLHYLEGLESKEIALRLRDNTNSIKSRIARGRRELRRRLEGVLTREGYL
jgi:RNA polymerase sigma-70 factor (ECF subfamily)